MNDTKVCTKCKQEKSLAEFYKRSKSKYFRSSCIACVLAETKAYIRTHREQRLKTARKYYQNHRQKVLEYAKWYSMNNPEKRSAHARAYYLRNKEKISARKKARRLGISFEEFWSHGNKAQN